MVAHRHRALHRHFGELREEGDGDGDHREHAGRDQCSESSQERDGEIAEEAVAEREVALFVFALTLRFFRVGSGFSRAIAGGSGAIGWEGFSFQCGCFAAIRPSVAGFDGERHRKFFHGCSDTGARRRIAL